MSARPAGWPGGGVHRVPGTAEPVAAGLTDQGWDVVVVPPVASDEELWDAVVAAFGLPGWFGRNLDALDETLGGLTRPTALVLASWTGYARARPERWRRLLHLLQDWADQPDPPRVVVLTD